MSIFKCFRRDDGGNVATMFALSLVPLFGVIGAAIDYSHVSEVRAKLADALDAAVLAVGTQPNVSEKDAFNIVNDWVAAHLGDDYAKYWHLDSVTLGEDGTIVAKATGSVDTTMTKLLGYDHVDIGVISEAIRSLGKVEVALVLDNTGSMSGTKLRKLKEAANTLVDSLAKATDDPNDLRIALVPFSMTVNVGKEYQNEKWIDNNAVSPIHDDIFNRNFNRFAAFNKLKTVMEDLEWAGCVESRPYPHDVRETEPTASIPESLYVPYFAPDEPESKKDSGDKNGDFGKFENDYLKDVSYSKTNWKIPQGNTRKYNSPTRTGRGHGPNAGCDLIPLVRLTTDTGAIKTQITKMTAVGNTNIPMGLAWGWNVLSPKGPFGDGVEYNDEEWNKVVVLMTDGQNEINVVGNKNESNYSGIGYIWQNRIGVGANSTAMQRRRALDNRLTELCSNMKADGVGITIYTVRVEVFDGSSEVLENCATQPDYFYDVKNVAQLEEVFKDIGGSIQKLRLSK